MSTPPIPTSQTCLLIIDNQLGFSHPTHWGPSLSTPNVHTNMTTLLQAFRAHSAPIIDIAHIPTTPTSPLHPSHPSTPNGTAFHPSTAPLATELVLQKSVNSAFIGTPLLTELRAAHIRRLVVVGLTTDHCVSTTVRMAANLGAVDFDGVLGEVVVVSDATAAWRKNGGAWDAETVHAVHLESLQEFALVRSTAEVVAELERSRGSGGS